MDGIRVWYEQLLAQLAAESYLDNLKVLSAGSLLTGRLRNGANYFTEFARLDSEGKLGATRMTGGESDAQIGMIEEFYQAWQIIDHLPNTSSGFSATLLKKINPKRDTSPEYTLSFRSTESKDAKDGGDVERDSSNGANGQIGHFGFAWAQMADMESYFKGLAQGQLAHPGVDQAARDSVRAFFSDANNTFNVTGYSLGGHLAQVFTLMHSNRVSHAYTFNGAGMGSIGGFDEAAQFGLELKRRLAAYQAIMNDPYTAGDKTGRFLDKRTFENLGYKILPGQTVDDLIRLAEKDRDPDSGNVYADPRHKLAMTAIKFNTTGAAAVQLGDWLSEESISSHDQITNLYGIATHDDRTIVAGSGQMFGTPAPVFIEDQPLFEGWDGSFSLDAILRSFGPTHSISLLADSLALMDLLHRFDSTLTYRESGPVPGPEKITNDLYRLLKLGSAQRTESRPLAEGDSLEGILDRLGRLYLPNDWEPSPYDRGLQGFASIANRDRFHNNIHRLRPFANGDDGEVSIRPLDGMSANDLAAAATSDIAYRYALVHLNPFVVTGSGTQDLYDQHNAEGELDLDSESNPGLTPRYLQERAQFVAVQAQWNAANGPPDDVVDRRFGDLESGLTIEVVDRGSGAIDPAVGASLFGTSAADDLLGGSHADALFGGEGIDRLNGLGGPDYLEGGEGSDVYLVGDGDTIYDSDGKGVVILDGTPLFGGLSRGFSLDGDRLFRGLDGTDYTLNGDLLTVSNGSSNLAIRGFEIGDLGIRLKTLVTEDLRAPVPILGTSKSDLDNLVGTAARERIFGFDDNDKLDGQEGDDELYGGTQADIVYGGEGNDILHAGDLNDQINLATPFDTINQYDWLGGNNGDDTLYGSVRRDGLEGGAGDDTLFAGSGDDYVYGDADLFVTRFDWLLGTSVGETTLYSGGVRNPLQSGHDFIDAGAGADRVWGQAGNDVIYGGGGDDLLNGDYQGTTDAIPGEYNGADLIDGGDGDDSIVGGGDDDVLFGGKGDDWIEGDSLQTVGLPFGFHGSDYLDGGEGSDTLIGLGNDDLLVGGEGNDFLFGDSAGMDASFHGDDLLFGDAGDDELVGQGGDDQLFGGDDDDRLFGDDSKDPTLKGDDHLAGGAGNDDLIGGDGNDYLDGGTGRDHLWGDDGSDTLVGGGAVDYLDGGTGADTYVFKKGESPIVENVSEQIVDTAGEGNRIVFDAGVERQACSVDVQLESGDLVLRYSETDYLFIRGGLTGTISEYSFGGGSFIPYDQFIGQFVPSASFLVGDAGNERVYGTNADDVMNGDAGHDELAGYSGDDEISGGAGNDRLIGGPGNDLLQGEGGSDSYVFGAGHGQDTVEDQSGFNQVYFTDANHADLTFVEVGSDLVISRDSDAVTIRNWRSDTVGQLKFMDGSFIRMGDVFDSTFSFGNTIIADTPGESVSGKGSDDDITVSAPGVTARGGAGDDIYRLSEDYPATVVDDASGDTTLIIDGDSRAEPYLNRDGDDLVVVLDGVQIARLQNGVINPPARMVAPSGVSYTGSALANRINDSPVRDVPVETATAVEDAIFRWSLPASAFRDQDDSFLAYSCSLANGDPLPDWLSFDSITRTLTGTPGNDAVGNLSLKVTATDKGGLDAESLFDLHVTNTNDAPYVASPPGVQRAHQDHGFHLDLPGIFDDVDAADSLTYSATPADGSNALPGWLSLDVVTGTLGGVPSSTDVGSLDLILTATDQAGAMASTVLRLTVEGDSNDVVVSSAVLGSILNYQVYAMTSAGDVDGDGFDDVLVQTAVSGSGVSNVFHGQVLPERSQALLYYGQSGGWSGNPARHTVLTDDAGFSQFAFGVYANPADDGFADVALKALGDVDGDGFADIGIRSFEAGKWVFRILHGSSGGWGSDANTISSAEMTIIELGEASYYGHDLFVATLDWDGDAENELVFSNDRAQVDLFSDFGRWKGQRVKASQLVPLADISFSNSGDVLGNGIISLNSVGDVNGDGFDDLFMTSQHARQRPFWRDPSIIENYTARAHRILFGDANSPNSIDLDDLPVGSSTEIFDAGYAVEALYNGLPVSGVGDVNGDGFDDLAVGYANNRLSIVFGGAEFRNGIHLDGLDGSNGFTITGLPSTYYATDGFEIDHGDINNDGFDDVVVGSFAGDDNGVGQNGLAWVVFGGESGFAPNIDVWGMTAADGFRLTTPYPDAPAAWSGRDEIEVHQPQDGVEQVAIADVDGDGITDLLKTAIDNGHATVQTLFGRASRAAGDEQQNENVIVANGGVVYTLDGDDLVTVRTGPNDTEIHAGAGDDVINVVVTSEQAGLTYGAVTVNAGDGDDILRVQVPQGASGVRLPSRGTYLVGGAGDDTYIVSNAGIGAGKIHISDAAGPGHGNNLVMGFGYSSASVRLSYGSLMLSWPDGGLQIHLENFDKANVLGGPRDIQNFQFDDGATFSYEDLVERGFDLDGTDLDDFIEGTSVVDRMNGFAGNDSLRGGDGHDVLCGGAGDDLLYGGAGDDTYVFDIDGGRDWLSDPGGFDVIRFGTGIRLDSLVVTRNGDDIEVGYGKDSRITIAGWYAGIDYRIDAIAFGDDQVLSSADLEVLVAQPVGLVTGTNENDTLDGTPGSDRLNGRRGDDLLRGFAGDDEFVYRNGDGFDRFYGGDGHDRVVAGPGDDAIGIYDGFDPANSIEQIDGGGGINRIQGSWRANRLDFSNVDLINIASIHGGAGNDVIIGTAGNDVLAGGRDNDSLYGGDGDDVFSVSPGDGSDRFFGGKGHDRVVAGAADDAIGIQGDFGAANSIEVIDGGAGINRIQGSWHASRLDFSNVDFINIASIHGGDGNDVITGTAGDDVLIGGRDHDTLYGGAGNDKYLFKRGEGTDRIVDTSGNDTLVFESASLDQLWLERSGKDLRIATIGASDSVTIAGWYHAADNRVEAIQAADGRSLLSADIDRLVEAMAAFTERPASPLLVSPDGTEDWGMTISASLQAA